MKPEEFNGMRVILRGEAAGGITKADVERRARELALIRSGREDYSPEDLADARRELMSDGDTSTTIDDEHSSLSANRDPSEPVSDAGSQHERTTTEDENITPEQLALQGVDEAQHDQMVQAREEELKSSAGMPRARKSSRQRRTAPRRTEP